MLSLNVQFDQCTNKPLQWTRRRRAPLKGAVNI